MRSLVSRQIPFLLPHWQRRVRHILIFQAAIAMATPVSEYMIFTILIRRNGPGHPHSRVRGNATPLSSYSTAGMWPSCPPPNLPLPFHHSTFTTYNSQLFTPRPCALPLAPCAHHGHPPPLHSLHNSTLTTHNLQLTTIHPSSLSLVP